MKDASEVESSVRAFLLEYFSPAHQERVDGYVESLLATDGCADRFAYLRSVVGPYVFRAGAKILISGCGAGSEMIVAKQLGFRQVCGVEVEEVWITACRMRFQDSPDLEASLYDGNALPYGDAEFDVIASGHVIEHTKDPEGYLRECVRVLTPGGYLSLEFPNRYHHRELHTRLPSFEWLPRPVRNSILRALLSRLSPLSADVKNRYNAIVATDLKQISMGGVRRMLNRIGHPYSILNSVRPAPGITRCVIRKGY